MPTITIDQDALQRIHRAQDEMYSILKEKGIKRKVNLSEAIRYMSMSQQKIKQYRCKECGFYITINIDDDEKDFGCPECEQNNWEFVHVSVIPV